MQKNNGRIIKGIGGFYYILIENQKDSAESFLFKEDVFHVGEDIIIEAKARGIFRHQKIKPMVGDHVKISFDEEGAIIEEILSRKNAFIRPPVANVDLAVLTFAITEPKIDFLLLDKLLIEAEHYKTEPIIVITKLDLIENHELEKIQERYLNAGYSVYGIFNDEKDDFKKLKDRISGTTAFLTGPSGVGKSTLTNRLYEMAEMATGELSKKLGRGKHTTRHVELFRLEKDTFLLDTPGFSSFDLKETLSAEELSWYFKEFPHGKCRFNTCTHRHEPDCAVLKALNDGKIASSRYEHYCSIYEELIKTSKKKRKK